MFSRETIGMISKEVIGVQKLVDIISLSLQSVFIGNEKNGVSLLLIANAESAKTTTSFEFSNLDFVSYYDDITQKKLAEEFIPQVKLGMKKTLIIPDLINCVEKQKVTRNGFLNLIKSAIDDTGVTAISTPNISIQKQLLNSAIQGTKFNLISGITKGSFMSGEIGSMSLRKSMIRTGLLTRFIPFSYEYDLGIRQEIFNKHNGLKTDDRYNVTIPEINKNVTNVSIDVEYGRVLENIAIILNNEFDNSGYGIRPHINLIRLTKAHALINHRNKVNKEDIDKVIELSNNINFKFKGLA